MEARVGDGIEVRSVQAGQPVRRGTVNDVLGVDPLELLVEWDDGHESVLFPAGGMVRVIESSQG